MVSGRCVKDKAKGQTLEESLCPKQGQSRGVGGQTIVGKDVVRQCFSMHHLMHVPKVEVRSLCHL